MVLQCDLFVAPLSTQIPVGSAGLTQTQFFMTENGAYDTPGVGTAGPSWWDKIARILSYASQIWQFTAGRPLASNLYSFPAITGSGNLNPGKGWIRQASFDCAPIPDPRYQWGSSANAMQLGFIQFSWQGFKGKLQPIQFASQTFFPEHDGADDVYYYLAPGVVATGETRHYDPSTAGVMLGSSYTQNILSDTNMGLPGLSAFPPSGTAGDTPAVSVPVGQGGLVTEISLPDPPNRTIVGLSSLTDYTVWMTILALLSETWQATAAANMEQTDGTAFAVSGEVGPVDTTAVITSAKFQLTAPLPVPKRLQYSSGLPLLGMFAFRNRGRFTRMMPINSANAIFMPDQQPANGYWIWLKPGVTGNMVLNTRNNPVLSMFTVSGEVNLVNGVVGGLQHLG